MAKWREDGMLELVGRRDNQVKVRGFRVELGEIESTLLRFEGVAKAVVVAVRNAGGQSLSAWLVPRPNVHIDGSEIRRWLKLRLPDYMIPSAIGFLDSLPLTSNGKLDRLALAAMGGAVGEPRDGQVAPRNEVESALERIVAGVLNVEAVGVEDDLFALGTDSIAIIQIVARARDRGYRIDPARVFQLPTIAALAAPLGPPGEMAGPSNSEAFLFAEIRDKVMKDDPEIEDAYPLTPVQHGMLYHEMLEAGSGAYVEQFHCRLEGVLDESAFVHAWERLVDRHTALRSSVRWIDTDKAIQVVARKVGLSTSRHDLSRLDREGQEYLVREILAKDRAKGFVPTLAPLTRMTLIRLAGHRRHLIWTSDHLIIDGWCFPILLSEALEFYEAEVSGRDVDLPPPRPFREFVEWLDRQDLTEAERFWRSALAGIREPTPIGLPAPRWDEAAAVPEEFEDTFSADSALGLKNLCRRSRITLATVIQGAWALLLSRYSGRSDICIGIAVSGRPADLPGVESMVGVLINTLPLRVTIEEERPILSWLRSVQATQVDMRQFEATPPVSIQEWSGVPRGLPLYECLVILQNTPSDAALESRASRLGIREPRVSDRTSYPLTLTVIPGQALSARLAFDGRRFDADAVRRMLGHFRGLVEGILGNPIGRLADLALEDSRKSDESPLIDSGVAEFDFSTLTRDEIDALLTDSNEYGSGGEKS
jgi:aryl carrier-like protein